jgi:hypothetical protein
MYNTSPLPKSKKNIFEGLPYVETVLQGSPIKDKIKLTLKREGDILIEIDDLLHPPPRYYINVSNLHPQLLEDGVGIIDLTGEAMPLPSFLLEGREGNSLHINPQIDESRVVYEGIWIPQAEDIDWFEFDDFLQR